MNKKILVLIFTAVLFAVPLFSSGLSFDGVAEAASLDYGESDQVFLETLDDLLGYENCGDSEITANKEIVYDINLNALGYVYDFSACGLNGYAIVIGTGDSFDLTEIYIGAVDPYENVGGMRIYFSLMNYGCFIGGDFYGTDGSLIGAEALEAIGGTAYRSGGNPISYSEETVYFSYRSESHYNLCARHPACCDMLNYSNGCVPVAGANLIQYYDRYRTNLIANYTPGTLIGSSYFYKSDSDTLEAVKIQLATDMSTNNPNPGTTIAQFLSGMSTYCTRSGYTFGYNSCMPNGVFGYSTAKQRLEAGQPLIIFVDGYTSASIALFDGHEVISYLVDTYAHAMAGFGWREITYTLTGGSQRFDRYIAVATGLSERQRGYFNVDYSTTVDDCYGITIS